MSLLTVRALPGQTVGCLQVAGHRLRCRLGRSGITDDKREGDGATPVGRFPLRRLFYRSDRLALPPTGLPAVEIRPDMGWCDTPADRQNYNRLTSLPYPENHEKLWRTDRLYDLVVELGYNDDPVVAGHGSAIFMHLERPEGGPTEGCVALDPGDLMSVLAACRSDSLIDIAEAGSPAEVRSDGDQWRRQPNL